MIDDWDCSHKRRHGRWDGNSCATSDATDDREVPDLEDPDPSMDTL